MAMGFTIPTFSIGMIFSYLLSLLLSGVLSQFTRPDLINQTLSTATRPAVALTLAIDWRKKSDRPINPRRLDGSPPLVGCGTTRLSGFRFLTIQCWSKKNAPALYMRHPHGSISLGSEGCSRRRFQRQPISSQRGAKRTEPFPRDPRGFKRDTM